MKSLLKIATAVLLVATAYISFSDTASASQHAPATKIMWGKTELKTGQIGKITVLQNTPLIKIGSDGKQQTVRMLKKGEEYRVYTYRSNFNGLYGVGDGSYVNKDTKIKYETPSKRKLELLSYKSLFEQAAKVKTETFSGNYTKEELLDLFDSHFTDHYTKQYMSNIMWNKDINGVRHYYIPGNDTIFSHPMFIENINWMGNYTIEKYEVPSVDPNNGKGTVEKVKISEEHKGYESAGTVKPHLYSVILLKTNDGTYKIDEIDKKYY